MGKALANTLSNGDLAAFKEFGLNSFRLRCFVVEEQGNI